MKKAFLNAFCMCLFFAASSQKAPVEYGFHSGLNVNAAYGKSVNNEVKGILTGISIGTYIKIALKSQLGLKVILAYDQQGWAYRSLYFADNTGSGLAKGDVLFKLNYLNLPVLAEYSFGKKIKFNADAGLFFGVLLNNWLITKIEQPSDPGRVTVTKTRSGSRSKTNFGICLGFGTQIPVSSRFKLNFDVRNATGLSSINRSTPAGESSIKTNTISIVTGLAFEL